MSEIARCPQCGTPRDEFGGDTVCVHCGGELLPSPELPVDEESATLRQGPGPDDGVSAGATSRGSHRVWALAAAALVVLVGIFTVVLGGAPPEGLQSAPALPVGEYLKQGNDLYAQGRFAEAAALYQQALRVDGGNVSARVNLGNAYFALDRLDQAAEAFRESLKTAPNDADVHSNLAAVLFRQGAVDEALSEAQSAVKLKPDLAEGHYILGVVYRQKGDTQRALAELQRTLELTKDARLKAETEAILSQLTK